MASRPRSAILAMVLSALVSPAASEGAAPCGSQGSCGSETEVFCSRGAAHDLALLQVTKTRASVRQAPGASALTLLASASEGQGVTLSTFFWNVHWECSMAARGASRACRERVGRRFVELAQASQAAIVASIELSSTMSDPASFEAFGLAGWTQVDGPCPGGDGGGDAAALGFAPGWRVERSSGGCLRYDWDTRAMAVALVTPPPEAAVAGCPSLCVVAIHAPHTAITRGKDLVQTVCGAAADRCTVAMGDWNTPALGVGRLWADLIGGASPVLTLPNERTCCFPESDHYGVYDHVATSILGALEVDHVVYPYQILEENPVKQHRPVAARLLLPAA